LKEKKGTSLIFLKGKKASALILLTGKEGMPPKSSMLAKANNTCRKNCSKM
jgi:hypothetical protein